MKFVNLQLPIPKKPHKSLKEVEENHKKKLKTLESNLTLRQILRHIQNTKTILNLFITKMLRVLKLEANVNGMKKVRSDLVFNLISKKAIR